MLRVFCFSSIKRSLLFHLWLKSSSFFPFSPGIILIRKKKKTLTHTCQYFQNWINWFISLEQFYSQSTQWNFWSKEHLLVRVNRFPKLFPKYGYQMRRNNLKTCIAIVRPNGWQLHIRFIDLGNALWISIIPEFLQMFNRNIFLKLIRSFALSRVPVIYSFHPTVIPYLRYASRKDSGNL